MVEASSPNELFLIQRDGDRVREGESESEGTYGVSEFKVFQVDLIAKSWVETKSLGDRAAFVGHSDSFSLKVAMISSPIIKQNHIYFTDDNTNAHSFLASTDPSFGGGQDMGMYNMEDGSFKPHFKGQSIGVVCPPIWVPPSFN